MGRAASPTPDPRSSTGGCGHLCRRTVTSSRWDRALSCRSRCASVISPEAACDAPRRHDYERCISPPPAPSLCRL